MPYVDTNGIRLSYRHSGNGKKVLLIMGMGTPGHVWNMHQVPALLRAGYAPVTFENRGIAPTDAPEGKYSIDDLVEDTKGLIEALNLAPCRVIGTSLGAMVAQEMAIRYPALLRCSVLIATRARADTARLAQVEADRALAESGLDLPAEYLASSTMALMLSPATANNDAAISSWLEVFSVSGRGGNSAGGQVWIDTTSDRRKALRAISAPCRVIAYSDDIITPPHLAAEVADAIPDCDYIEIPDCGHLGNLEQPEKTNIAIIEFLDKH
ncbi:MAG TPA: alpha/beta fold hydrolase [Trebonia sp.]|jgi:pimeloyl-ACP methyl ester carboxylesterase|nr:alpha/beta fold hydrolase [Trebonia sp.]